MERDFRPSEDLRFWPLGIRILDYRLTQDFRPTRDCGPLCNAQAVGLGVDAFMMQIELSNY